MSTEIFQIRANYETRRQELRAEFLRTGDADHYLRVHTDELDSIVSHFGNLHFPSKEFCVLATAGYGRREQFPQSDVDLLIVHDCGRLSEAEKRISAFLRDLWDTKLLLGQQVWSLQELGGMNLREDYQFILALFDARFVFGDQQLGSTILEGIIPEYHEQNHSALLDKIVEIIQKRHENYGATIYQLEPDLKESPGGLRDHLGACWVDQLTGALPFLPFDRSEIKKAHGFLKRLRILLHLLVNRPDDRMTHKLQEQLVPYLGYGTESTQSGVESLMKEYFLNARVIFGYCQGMLGRARPTDVSRELDADSELRLESVSDVLAIFERVLEEGSPLSDGIRKKIVEALPALSESVRFPSLREQLRRLLHPRAGLYTVLSEMYELGVLELLFPEFGTIKARVIRDFYHKYTVDEHTLRAIKCIEDLTVDNGGKDARFGSILKDTVTPHHLTLALLFHDVGKSRGGKHADQSARMARMALQRFRFRRDEINTIVLMIRNHLGMASVIFRRDLEDEEVVQRFADLVETPEHLRLLTLLTFADIKAVAPGTMNGWKKDLLWQLYLAAYRKLTLEFGERRIEEENIGARLLKGLDPGMDQERFESFLEGFPTRYLRTFEPQEIYEHFGLSTAVQEVEPVQSQLLKRKTHYELCVITPDRRRLFAKIVGLLSFFEMNILRGYAYANRQQTILDFFQFSDERKSFKQSEERKRFQDLLSASVQGKVSVEALINGKEQSVLYRKAVSGFAPSLYFEDEQSEGYTIMEIVAPDAMGLLYRISNEIAQLGIDIDLALISTEGETAVDVFYLCFEGGKLSSEQKDELSNRIIQAIS